jgi:hypothetical protein
MPRLCNCYELIGEISRIERRRRSTRIDRVGTVNMKPWKALPNFNTMESGVLPRKLFKRLEEIFQNKKHNG